MKKTIITISVILALAAMGIGVYFAWRKSQEILNPPASGQLPSVSNQVFEPQSGSEQAAAKLRAISSQPIFDYWVINADQRGLNADQRGKTATSTRTTSTSSMVASSLSPQIFYLNQEGKISTIKNNKDEEVVSEPIPNLQFLKSSPDGKIILIKHGDLTNPKFTLWNAEAKVKQSLANVSVAAFSPDSKQIAYLEKSTNNLAVKDLFGVKPKTQNILKISQVDFDLLWIHPQKILLFSKPSFDYEGKIWSLDLKTKTFTPLISARGLMINWSPQSRMGLVWSENESGSPQLNLMREDGTILTNFDLVTFPAKCAISQPKVYCALPQSYNSISEPTLPDDYLKRAVYSRDFIYRIDMNQNTLEPVFAGPEPAIDALNLQILGDQLFFVNRYDNRLYSLQL